MKTIFIAAALAAFVLVSPAVHAGDFGGSLSTRFLSQDLSYIGGLSLERPVQENDLYISLPWKGFYIDLWHSTGLNKKDHSVQEISWATGWGGMVSNLRVKVAMRYCDYAMLLDKKGGDYISPFAEVGLPLKVAENHNLEPFFLFELAFPAGDSHPDVGIYATGGLKHRWEIGSLVVVCQKLGFRYYEVQNSPEYGCLVDYNFTLTWKIHKIIKWDLLEHVSLDVPIVKATFMIFDQHEAKEKELKAGAIGAGLTIKF